MAGHNQARYPQDIFITQDISILGAAFIKPETKHKGLTNHQWVIREVTIYGEQLISGTI